jgi:DNA polymerase-1
MKPIETVLIDADITAFQVCSSAEVETDWGDDVWTLHSDFAKVKSDFKEAITSIQDMTGAPNVILAFTSSTNFRKSVYEPYKSNRKKSRKPMHLMNVRRWAADYWDTREWEGLEGDDVLGILATADDSMGIYSADKDMATLPANLWSNDERFFYLQAENVADWYWMSQTLSGDPTDGYPGLPGIGKKRAADMLGEPGERPLEDMWEQVVAAYENKGLTADDALTQARCARILRCTDYSLEEGEIKLWTPTAL